MYHVNQKFGDHATSDKPTNTDTVNKLVIINFHDFLRAKNIRKKANMGLILRVIPKITPAQKEFFFGFVSRSIAKSIRKRTIMFTCPIPKENLVGKDNKVNPVKSRK